MTTNETVEHRVCRGRTPVEDAMLGGDGERSRAARIAQAYTEIFERLAPHHGFASVTHAWRDAPPNGRALLTAAFAELLPLVEAPMRDQLSETAIDRDRWRRIVELLAQAAAGRPGVEYVAELAETLARVTALPESWRQRPGWIHAATELEDVLNGRDQ